MAINVLENGRGGKCVYRCTRAGARVPGLTIRYCADISNNVMQRGAQVNAIYVTENMIFERLYFVSGLDTFGP